MAENNHTPPMKCGPSHDQYVVDAEKLGVPKGTCVVCLILEKVMPKTEKGCPVSHPTPDPEPLSIAENQDQPGGVHYAEYRDLHPNADD